MHTYIHTYEMNNKVTVAEGDWAGNFPTSAALGATVGGTYRNSNERHDYYCQLL